MPRVGWIVWRKTILLLVFLLTGIVLFQQLTGVPGLLIHVVLPFLLALGVAALIVVVVGARGLRRHVAPAGGLRRPLRALADSYPARQRSTLVVAWVLLAIWLFIGPSPCPAWSTRRPTWPAWAPRPLSSRTPTGRRAPAAAVTR